MSQWKFAHAADIHLDSPLVGLQRCEDAPAEELRGSTRKALANLVELCIAEQVEFLLIAGDIYDGDWRDYNTGLFFHKQLARLKEAGIPVYMIRGNHDAASQITRQLKLPDNVHEFGSKVCDQRLLEDLGVAIHGHSFAKQAVMEDISQDYPQAQQGFFNIGLLHTCATGKDGHERYAPCSVPGLTSKGYNYWALGHVHTRETLSQEPWIVFPGNLQGRHARETGEKGCSLVTVQDGEVHSVEHRVLDVVRWSHIPVTWQGSIGQDEVLDHVQQALRQAGEAGDGRLAAVRLTIKGECVDHVDLMSKEEEFRQSCYGLTYEVGDAVWLEKVKIETRAPIDMAAARSNEGPVGDLLRFLDEKRNDAAFAAQMWEEFNDLTAKLPPEYKNSPEALRFGDPDEFQLLLADVERELVPSLLGKEVAQ